MVSHGRKLAVVLLSGLVGGPAFALSESGWMDATPAARPSQEASADPGDSVTISRRAVEAAGVLERYLRTTSGIGADFSSAASVSEAVLKSASYEPRQLEEGAVAYAALMALQEPTFVAALSSLANDSSGRAAWAGQLVETPDRVLDVPGARQAAGVASAALARMGSELVARGRAVKQAAYSIQREPWSLQPVEGSAARLSQVKARAHAKATLTDAETQQLVAQVVAGREGLKAGPAAAPTPTVIRGLALAALAMLGQAGEDRADDLAPLLRDPATGECLKFAKLNLHQCLAVAGPQYEDVFCMGEHAMADTGQCIVNAAGGRSAAGVRVSIARTPRAPAAVSVPVARAVPAVQAVPVVPAEGSEAQAAYGPRPSAADDNAQEASDTVAEAPKPDVVEGEPER
jgi:hypothetical protein